MEFQSELHLTNCEQRYPEAWPPSRCSVLHQPNSIAIYIAQNDCGMRVFGAGISRGDPYG